MGSYKWAYIRRMTIVTTYIRGLIAVHLYLSMSLQAGFRNVSDLLQRWRMRKPSPRFSV